MVEASAAAFWIERVPAVKSRGPETEAPEKPPEPLPYKRLVPEVAGA